VIAQEWSAGLSALPEKHIGGAATPLWNGRHRFSARGCTTVSDLLSVIARDWHLLLPIGVVGALSWSIWLIRKLLSARYRPTVNDFRTTTSVVVPSFREDPEVLERCLDTWLAQDPTEVIVVLDVEDTEAFARLTARDDPRLTVISFAHEGKRSALGVGIRAARGEVLVLCDSDTNWQPGLLDAVQMPFADPVVGAVSTRQNVYLPTSSVWRRVADWIIDLRYLDYVPATSRAGAVVCVSGRTAAYRRSAVLPVLEHLEHEFFLGRRCIAGDDGRLTWLVLASGYKTVYQGSARALSMFPSTFRAFCKQRVRWSRNSYRCYLTAAWKGWLWRQPLVSQVTVLQILFTPVTMFAAVYYVVASGFSDRGWQALGLSLAWVLIGRGIRSVSHLRRRPSDLLILPLVAMVIALVALPIKTYALFTMNKQGWLTRRADLTGGEGQDEASLTPVAPAAVTA
jgi:cellulose synthase/poly-beta-1,6-N-acetylglucosamine synthase-like glycosyltransferase